MAYIYIISKKKPRGGFRPYIYYDRSPFGIDIDINIKKIEYSSGSETSLDTIDDTENMVAEARLMSNKISRIESKNLLSEFVIC